VTGWTLHGTGERSARDWPELLSGLAGWRAAWADLDGFHLAVPLPDALPVTSHLWAWTAGGWLRVRVDGGHWWGSALLHGSGVDPSIWAVEVEQVAEIMVERVWSWAADDGRVAQLRPRGLDVPEQMVPVGPQPAVYIGDLASVAALPAR
jgi:hypothetical protein